LEKRMATIWVIGPLLLDAEFPAYVSEFLRIGMLRL